MTKLYISCVYKLNFVNNRLTRKDAFYECLSACIMLRTMLNTLIMVLVLKDLTLWTRKHTSALVQSQRPASEYTAGERSDWRGQTYQEEREMNLYTLGLSRMS